jgi:hypothetical protein
VKLRLRLNDGVQEVQVGDSYLFIGLEEFRDVSDPDALCLPVMRANDQLGGSLFLPVTEPVFHSLPGVI